MRYVLQSGFICLISSFESKNMVRRKKNFQKNFSKFFTRPGREKATSSKNFLKKMPPKIGKILVFLGTLYFFETELQKNRVLSNSSLLFFIKN